MILTAVVFDSEGLSAWIRRDRGVMTLIQDVDDMRRLCGRRVRLIGV